MTIHRFSFPTAIHFGAGARKLVAKHLDLIVANRVGVADGGFESDQNAMTAFWADGERVFVPGAKTHLADELIDLIVERLDA
mgnify:CR=1 FL=1